MGIPVVTNQRLLAACLLAVWVPFAAVAGDKAAEQQRLDDYGWSLSEQLLYGENSLYAPLNLSVDRPLMFGGGFDRGRGVRTGGGRTAVWQDPELGLVSAIASYLEYGTEQHYRFGAEGQWYHGSITASGRAGYLTGSSHSYLNREMASQPFAGVDVRWYATDNLSFEIGGEQIEDITMGRLRLEYQPVFRNLKGLSFFAHAAGGHVDSEYVLGGFRYSFGDSPSLMLRDRGDPDAAALDRLSPYFRSMQTR